MNTSKAVAAVQVKPRQYELTLKIEGLTKVPGDEDGLYTLTTNRLPAEIKAQPIIECLKEQSVDPRDIDAALEAMYESLHKSFVAGLFATRVQYLGAEQV